MTSAEAIEDNTYVTLCSTLMDCAELIHQNKETMTTAILQTIDMWKNGELHASPPTTDELSHCLQYLKNLPQANPDNREDAEQIKLDFSALIANNIGRHFSNVHEHRQWIKLTYELLKISGVPFFTQMDRRIEMHDLTKYGPDEALGYSILLETYGKPLNATDKQVCKSVSYKHCMNNSHHSQYHGDGQMSDDDLKEAVIDLIAHKLEGSVEEFEYLNGRMIVNIHPAQFVEYKPSDQVRMKDIIDVWFISLDRLIEYATGKEVQQLKDWMGKSGYKNVSTEQYEDEDNELD